MDGNKNESGRAKPIARRWQRSAALPTAMRRIIRRPTEVIAGAIAFLKAQRRSTTSAEHRQVWVLSCGENGVPRHLYTLGAA